MSEKKMAKKSIKKVTTKLPQAPKKLLPVIDEPAVRKAFFDLATLVSRVVALANRELDAYEKSALGPLASLGKVIEEAKAREGTQAIETFTCYRCNRTVPSLETAGWRDFRREGGPILCGNCFAKKPWSLEGKDDLGLDVKAILPTQRTQKLDSTRAEVHGARPSVTATLTTPLGSPTELE